MRAGDAERALITRYDNEIWDTCALDIADEGGLEYDDLAPILGVSREMISKITASAVFKLKKALELDSVSLAATERRKTPVKNSKAPAARFHDQRAPKYSKT